MAEFSIQFDAKDLLSKLPTFGSGLKTQATSVLEAALARGEAVGKANAKVRTGYMRSQVHVQGTSLIAGAPYSGFVEARFPFMAPAYDAVLAYLQSAMPSAIKI
jgi:hypothetical protein